MKNSSLTKRIICVFFMLLVMASSVPKAEGASYAASSKSDCRITLTSKSDATMPVARQLDEYLSKGKTVDIYVKGSKSASQKTVKALQKRIKKANTLGVIFKTKSASKSGKSYLYRITKKEVRQYNYGTKFIKLIWEEAVKAAEEARKTNYKSPEEDEDLQKKIFDFWFYYSFDYEDDEDYDVDEEDEDRETQIIMTDEAVSYINMMDSIFSHRYFCELSDAQKLYVINASGYFSSYMYYGVHKNAKNLMFMEYDTKSSGKIHKKAGKEPDQVMKVLYKNKAKGVCSDFAAAEKLLFSQLGIKGYYLDSDKENHAWSLIKVSNSKGKKFYIPFDYYAEIYSKQEIKAQKKYLNKMWKDRAYKKGLWKQHKRPSDLPKKINYSWDDIC